MDKKQSHNVTCTYREGSLPKCAPLAVPYVPFQQENSEMYNQKEALNHGTLFPGLDLPFKNMTSVANVVNTPLTELMALDFAIKELGLYLDTHKDDQEAFELFKSYVKLSDEGRKKYVQMYGPLQQTDTAMFANYNWLNDPWPWEAQERTAIK